MKYIYIYFYFPIRQTYLYNISNFMFTDDLFAPYMPLIDFNYTMYLYNDKVIIVTYNAEGSIVKK